MIVVNTYMGSHLPAALYLKQGKQSELLNPRPLSRDRNQILAPNSKEAVDLNPSKPTTPPLEPHRCHQNGNQTCQSTVNAVSKWYEVVSRTKCNKQCTTPSQQGYSAQNSNTIGRYNHDMNSSKTTSSFLSPQRHRRSAWNHNAEFIALLLVAY